MYSKTILIGRLTADPDLRKTQNGIAYTRVRLAVDRAVKDKNGERKTDFIPVTAWRQSAEFICKYFAKGRLMGVDGTIQTGEYTDREGHKRATVEVAAERIFFADSKPQTPAPDVERAPAASGTTGTDYTDIPMDDDLPF